MPAEELERRIEACTDAIWMELPPDLRRLCDGIIASGAGTYGQGFSPLLFVQSELRGLTINACYAILVCAEDPAFTLPVLQASARAHLAGRVGLLAYLGLHELGELFGAFLAMLDELDRETFLRLLRALKTYGARMHMWALHVFPWELGLAMPRIDRERAAYLLDEASRAAPPAGVYHP